MNAVESLFVRLGISAHYAPFAENNIDKVVHLRHLSDEDLRSYIPDEGARAVLKQALDKSAAQPAAPAAAPQRYADDTEPRSKGTRRQETGDRRPRPKRVCRDFFDSGCGYGSECRFSHDVEQHKAEGAQHSTAPLNREIYKEEISVPWDSVKLLLGNKAEKLNRINAKWGTTNSRIEKPEAFHQTYSFDLRGTPEGVKGAKSDIEQFVGITSAKNREARFQYANHELERNQHSVEFLCAANLKNQGTPLELSSTVLQRVARTFRFRHEPKVTQFWTLSSNGTDKDKFETIMPLVKQMRGVSCIIFAEPNRVEEMAKRSKQTAEALGVKNPQFVHRKLSKEDRMRALETFKAGEVNEHGVVQRCLVTNNDYAKYARKVLIPYVNLVLHFSIPKTKELYLHQTNCTGRNNHEGISVLFITHHDATTQKEWSAALDLRELTGRGFEEALGKVDYDTTDRQLTAQDSDPKPNWREEWEKEKAEKAAAKAAAKAARA
uniref:ATP-dependent RNA helicase n=1 Tax=Neobodo designis TaxID=312471 RepID=A0A7S1W6U4_NEODS|mmetsp:Transcript_54735/g.168636  ORF Transcript_54735/g.168636 Transcript_54735/m.168636 type:complete len:493 (+) Transcript_54735:32-1510(+)|eukprot:CAMPEP_0174850012 /NCGR_PEP_ID=MMETSP1114-20130205/18649_1 /TAXON_ID=312471 /ORGANISM="Neobodo designis, Strain CCAP 1951/1" /LENGTH=492 /DNA_ID=CAMNT_0016084435 /DNA_START=34 /DNA_END=1512 /DNA_ORIENTATION=+